MGIFSTYTGLIYSEFASVPFNVLKFMSCYKIEEKEITWEKGCVYPLGFDTIWTIHCKNELVFLNSFKMKISVLYGFFHMALGLILKAVNSIRQKKPIIFLFEFLPQFIFLSSIIGYMNVLIVVKWLRDWSFVHEQGPDIIMTMINMVLKFGSISQVPVLGGLDSQIQQIISATLFCVAMACIPIMWLTIPLILRCRQNKINKYLNVLQEL